MKKTALIAITALSFTACNNPKADNKAEHEKDSLQSIINERDSTLSNYLASFSDITNTLDSINNRQNNIVLKIEKPSDLKSSTMDEMRAEVVAINNLMEKNREKIESLNRKLKMSAHKNGQLEKAIQALNGQLAQKEDELASLNAKLTNMNIEIGQLQASVGFLSVENAIQTTIIANKITEQHRVYYIIGTSKDLKKEHVIDKTGGLLGMGKTAELNKDFDASKFTPIDYTQTLTIPVDSKKIELIPNHPGSSYKIEKENGRVKDILITNPEEFWNASKYLVIIKGA